MPQVDREEYNAYCRTYQRRRNIQRIALGREHLGGVCIECGADDDLDFDHIDPETKRYCVTDGTCTNLSMARFMAEVDKCQLLCKPCHLDKTRMDRERVA